MPSLPDTASKTARAFLNGSSFGQVRDWPGTDPGSYLLGPIVDRQLTTRGVTLVVRAEEGTEGDREIEPGSLRRLTCQPAILRQMVERFDPQPGDLLGVVFDGLVGRRLRFAYNIEKRESGDVLDF